MFWRKRSEKRKEELDRLGRELLRANALTDHEAESVTSSPLLYRRIRAHIADDKSTQQGFNPYWLPITTAAWHVLPLMMLIALWAAVNYFTISKKVTTASIDDIKVVGVCSLSAKKECAVSINEAIAAIVSSNDKEGKQ
ncbi:MAG: hypothetical protein AB1489_17085 [Acidobacteriota bacterium]